MYGAQHTDYHNSLDALQDVKSLGKLMAQHDCITLVPTTAGFPRLVAKGAQEAGGQVIGFSPAAHQTEHVEVYNLPTSYMDMIIYSGFGYTGSDLLLSRSSDAVIFGYGGVETIHEFWVAFQENKPIGVLKGEWSTDEVLHDLLKDNPEFDHERVIFDEDPNRLLEQLIKRARSERVQRYHV